MSHDAAREEAVLEEEAHRRAEDIRATQEATAHAADPDLSPDVEIAPQVHRSRPQHDHADTDTDTAVYQRPQVGGRRGPRR